MKDAPKKIDMYYGDRIIPLRYNFHDLPLTDPVNIEVSLSMGFSFDRTLWKTVRDLAQDSLIKRAIKKEDGRGRLVEIVGIKESLDINQKDDVISLTLEGTAKYS